jgi:hypothetical protein
LSGDLCGFHGIKRRELMFARLVPQLVWFCAFVGGAL